ncbi:hypothetical protein GCM10010358_67910 [Streptomyces minutiscleroticus]|uniref:Uncharacterized protein n=1 Tax=Streptomyces minutiscleroticus TaxID=68238 RepID=A0A918U7W7_9ACTN|nr:hypothetical protein GCM10010358_67910 [Streptomyces minutiscleroticus]
MAGDRVAVRLRPERVVRTERECTAAAYSRQVSTRKRPLVNPVFDLAQSAGSGLYLSASVKPFNPAADRPEEGRKEVVRCATRTIPRVFHMIPEPPARRFSSRTTPA